MHHPVISLCKIHRFLYESLYYVVRVIWMNRYFSKSYDETLFEPEIENELEEKYI